MSELAGRMRRPSWKDPRLAIGLVLVALSVALGIAVVAGGRNTVEVWAASRTLAPGDSLDDVLTIVEVPEGFEDSYVPASDAVDGVVNRVVAEGELLPRSAVVAAGEMSLRTVVVTLGEQVSAAVGTGTIVDLWLNPAEGGPAELIREGLIVRAVAEERSAFATNSGSTLELLVPEQDVQSVLTAMNDGGPLVAVPRAGE